MAGFAVKLGRVQYRISVMFSVRQGYNDLLGLFTAPMTLRRAKGRETLLSHTELIAPRLIDGAYLWQSCLKIVDVGIYLRSKLLS